MSAPRILRFTVLAWACSALMTAYAGGSEKYLKVPPGDLATALESLVKQTDIQLVYQGDQLKGLHTQGVSGNLSPQEAVRKLLEGTSLLVRVDASGGMLI